MLQFFSSPQSRRLLVIGLLLPCLLVCIPALIAFRGQRQLADSTQWVSHTFEVDRQLQRLLTLIISTEASHRGFLMTGRGEFLESSKTAVEEIPSVQSSLHLLMLDNHGQQEKMARLDELVKAKLAFMTETEVLQERGDTKGAVALIGTGRGSQIMRTLQSQLADMQQEERRLLQLRQKSLAHQARLGTVLLTALVGASLLLAGTIFVMLRRLARAEAIVRMCAWSRTIEYEGEWISFEAYLLRRFGLNTSHGISPTEAAKVIEEHHFPPEHSPAGRAEHPANDDAGRRDP